jgi:ketosteroid isomerase-like protein
MSTKSAVDVVSSFVAKINAHDVAGLCELMPEGHVFVDSLGNAIHGRETICAGWKGYFAWFPDYEISITKVFHDGDEVALFGTARGTYCVDGNLLNENKWEIPAAWRAIVRDGLVAEWRVYADNSPVMQIMEASKE